MKNALHNQVALGLLVDLLSKAEFFTASQIADVNSCSKITAYRQLKQLEKFGFEMETKLVRQSATGPESVAYKIIKHP